MFSRTRPRPLGPTKRVGFDDAAVLIALEDQLLERLAAYGCGLRAPPPRWRIFAGDMHHRIDLSFDAEGVLVEARNLPRKGPKTEGLTGEVVRQLNQAVRSCLDQAVGARFESAPPNQRVSVYLPLAPVPS